MASPLPNFAVCNVAGHIIAEEVSVLPDDLAAGGLIDCRAPRWRLRWALRWGLLRFHLRLELNPLVCGGVRGTLRRGLTGMRIANPPLGTHVTRLHLPRQPLVAS